MTKTTQPATSALALFALLLSVQSGWSFYNPETGRWLNRDPNAERGGKNLHTFVRNDSLGKLDLLGLDYRETIRFQSLIDIYLLYGVWAFTGDPGTVSWSRPYAVSSVPHVIADYGCCAEVESAQRVDVEVISVLPNDGIGMNFTARGFAELAEHEGRRREVYRKAYEAYIAPVQGTGTRVKACGMICWMFPKDTLLDYLNRSQAAGIAAFNLWVEHEQDCVGEENQDMIEINGLFDHYRWPYSVPDPPRLEPVPCY